MTYLVAIGGFRLHHWTLAPVFARFAIPAFNQARKAPGCAFADTRQVHGLYFSLTAWDSPATMRAYAGTGKHLRAMRAAARLGDGPFAHYTSDSLPTWEEALDIWKKAHPEALSQPAPAR